MSSHIGNNKGRRQRVLRALPILAAGLALLTFIVKDAIREDLRDVVDSISRADDVTLIRMDLARTQILLSNARLQLNTIVASQKQLGPLGFESLDDRERAYQEQLSVADSLIDSSERLLGSLPPEASARFEPQLLPLRAELVAAWTKWKNLNDKLESSERVPPHQPSSAEAKGVIDADQALESTFKRVSSATESFVIDAVRSADQLKERKENAYRVWTYASWLLFGVAWALGVFGRLSGIPGVDDP